MLFKVTKGNHDFAPLDFPKVYLNPPELNWKVTFLDSYKLPAKEQGDWNKGGGLSFNLFSNTKNSTMWAWRWNLKQEKMEVMPYYHLEGKVVWVEKSETFVPLDTEIKINMEVLNKETVQWTIGRKNYLLPIKASKLSRRIGLWFGGNNPAPNNIRIKITS